MTVYDEFVTRLFNPAAWIADAACRGMDIATFFPERGDPGRQAKATCETCPVQTECAEAGAYEHGIWGGQSPRDRRQTRRSPYRQPAKDVA